MDILDLRAPDHARNEADDRIVTALVDGYESADFAELLDLRMRLDPGFGDLIGHETEYMRKIQSRGSVMVNMFHDRLDERFSHDGRCAALDVGCGTGAALLGLSQQYEIVVGIDPSLPGLILARKALETAGRRNVQLVQAFGQRIPCANNTFDYVNALNVVEHVFEIEAVMGEVHRVLDVGGRFGADSRNRYDLFTPEPHVKLRLVGWMPRGWAVRYVRLRRRVEYDSTRLLSYGDLEKALQTYFASQFQITYPLVSAYGVAAHWDQVIRAMERMPRIGSMLLRFFPAHLVLAQK
jgi:ubiquinone/menaquinone biosynthesis C-methylase UbiE